MLNCLAGLDEAGLGPILGPLVVAGVAMQGPAGVDPWDALEPAVARQRPRGTQLHVADSKKVHTGARGFEKLERTVLTFWTAWRGRLPADLGELLCDIGYDTQKLAACPWYADLGIRLPLANDADAIELAGHLLRQRMAAARIEILRIALRPVEVVEFNDWILETDNKSTTHFRAYAEVLGRLLDEIPDGAHVVADRAGGRMHYRSALLATKTTREVRVERETPDLSVYRLGSAHGHVRVSFAAGGEERAFPTALASCAAKYLRELFVERLNTWFCNAIPGLAPTAGYYVDGKRFLGDIAALVERERVPARCLVRLR